MPRQLESIHADWLLPKVRGGDNPEIFQFFESGREDTLFFSSPVSFNHRTSKDLLAYAVRAALYMPATRTHIADDIMNGKHEGLTTIIIDLEDAVGDSNT